MKTVKMLGTEIGSETRGDVREAFAQVSWFIRRGHNVCGDSAFVHMDDSKVVAAVLDGVSGEPGADQASSVAAVALVNHLKNIASPDKNDIQNAFVKAHSNIVFGLTTVALAVTSTLATVPPRSARSSFCIFMASSTSSDWPELTASPRLTTTPTTLPGIGARTSPAPWPVPACPSISRSSGWRSRTSNCRCATRRRQWSLPRRCAATA